MFLPNISDAERIFAELLTGLLAAQPGFPLAQLKTFVDQEFAQIKHVLHGISLLGQCPDSINAALICRGEKMSIAIMAGVLEARGHNVTVIDPVEKLLAVGHYLESTVDIVESTRWLRQAAFRPIQVDGRFHRRYEKGETGGTLDATVPTTPRRCWLPVYAPIVARFGRTLTGSIPATRVRCPMRGC